MNGAYDPLKPDEDIASTTRYDSNGNIISTTQAANITGLARTTYTWYDPLNRPITVTTNYTGTGAFVAFNAANPDLNLTTLTRYDTNGNVISTTQLYGSSQQNTTYTWYDALNRPVTVTTNYTGTGAFVEFNPAIPDKNISTLTQYDSNGNVITTTHYLGIGGLERKSFTQYDALNRPITVTTNYTGTGVFDPTQPDRNIPTVTQYDVNGNIITTTQYAGISGLERKTFTQYDILNRPITTTTNYVNGLFDPAKPDEDIQTLTRYDAPGNVLTSTQFANVTSLSRKVFTQYDALNRPITTTTNYVNGSFDSTQPDEDIIHVTIYNGAGDQVNSIEYRGGPGLTTTAITTTYTYDKLSRMITTTLPLTGTSVATTTVSYDGLGRLVDQVDPLGHKTRTNYDLLDRPVTVTVNYVDGVFNSSITDEDLQTVTTYDAAGNRTKVTDPKSIATQFQYDLLNRLIKVTDALTGTTRYTYTAASNVISITDALTHTTNFGYDLLDRVITTTDPLTHTTVYTYNAASDRTQMKDAIGAVTVYTYNLRSELTNIDYPSGTTDITYTYDGVGQRTIMTDSVGTTTWKYDLLSRPITVTDPFTGTVIYTYDSAGDRLKLKYPDGKVVTYTYDLANRLVQATDWLTNTTRYTYDSASRLTTLALPNGITSTYTYDNADRVINLTQQLITQTVAVYTYTVDAVGNRTQVVESLLPVLTTTLPAPTPTPIASGNITVTTTVDENNSDGDCSLREAIRAANLNQAVDACPAGGANDVIIVPAGVYSQTIAGASEDAGLTGDLDITSTLTIQGASAANTIIDGNREGTSPNVDRVLHVLTDAVNVNINNVTIQNGKGDNDIGGGIYNAGTLTLNNSIVNNNFVSGTFIPSGTGIGGGIYNAGTLVLNNTALTGNFIQITSSSNLLYGGGIYNTNSGIVTLINSSISNSQAWSDTSGGGGGIYNNSGTVTLINSTINNNSGGQQGGGGLDNESGGTMTIINSTISNNTLGGGIYNEGVLNLSNSSIISNTTLGDAGGIYNSNGGTVNFKNTIIAGNTGGSGSDCSGTITSQGYNLIQSTTGCTITGVSTGNITGSSANVGPLQNNGSSSFTHALLSGSPAIDAGSPSLLGSGGSSCEATDQRGFARPIDGDNNGSFRCDIGAYEYGYIAIITTTDELNTNGNCSLREAIRAANRNLATDACPAGVSKDILMIPAGTYTLTVAGADDTAVAGDLDITGTVTLQGVGADLTTIKGGSGWTDRIFHVLTTTVQFNDLTLQSGNISDVTNGGGGLYNQAGTVTLSSSAVISNTSSGTSGGGIYSRGGAMSVINSAVLSNTVTADNGGGGVYIINSAIVTITNSTLSSNKAKSNGGGVNVKSGTATINNTTISNNTADSDANNVGDGGGIYSESGTTVKVKNTISAGNTDASTTTKHPDASGTFVSQGYNLIGWITGTTNFTATGDITSTPALLNALANNGGSTLTHALQSGSPAIEKGNPAVPGSTNANACAMTDQRGYARPADGDRNGSALCDIGAYEFRAAPTITITYTYDPLYRLTNATYSNGSVYTNTYDAVGNRLTQTVLTGTTTFTYDAANRLTKVNAITYTWDNNGNLLTEGTITHTYNAANQLITSTTGVNTWAYKYNGQGDRLKQIFNGTVTTYTLDLAVGLTQVLVDVTGSVTNTYLYGNGRIAQYTGANPNYFLGDALGSVRQTVNATGAITMLRSYQPYGAILSQAGTSSPAYGFTGEWRDTTGLMYLRARYYRPGQGRFISKDAWPGDYRRPLTLNGWSYVEGNPINHLDPSGRCKEWKSGIGFVDNGLYPWNDFCPPPGKGGSMPLVNNPTLDTLRLNSVKFLECDAINFSKPVNRTYLSATVYKGWYLLRYVKRQPLFTVTDEINESALGMPEVGTLIQPDFRQGENTIRFYDTNSFADALSNAVFGVKSPHTIVNERTVSGGVSGGSEFLSEWGAGYEQSYTRDNLSQDRWDISGYGYIQYTAGAFTVRYETPCYLESSLGIGDWTIGLLPKGATRGIACNIPSPPYHILAHASVINRYGGLFEMAKREAPTGYQLDRVIENYSEERCCFLPAGIILNKKCPPASESSCRIVHH